MQSLPALFQAPSGEESHKTVHVIAVQVTDKDVIAAVEFDLAVEKLHLRSFATVDQKKLVFNLQNLRCVVPSVKRATSRIAKNGNEHGIVCK